MSDYNTYPAVDSVRNFPPSVRAALAAASELLNVFAHDNGAGQLVIGSTPVEPTPQAGLNTIGWVKAVFIPNEGTIPTPIDPYTIVIELV
jgi:hypothetical protein